MEDELAEFLARHQAVIEETERWHGRTLPLRVRSYLSNELPPLDLIPSARGLVFRNDEVLVVRDAGGRTHLTPGGQRETGETLIETWRREVLEEAGWTLREIRQLGF